MNRKRKIIEYCPAKTTMHLPIFMSDKYDTPAEISCRNPKGHKGKHRGWFDFVGTEFQYGVKEWD